MESTEKISVKAYEEVFGEEDTDDNASASNSVRKKTSADDLVAIDDCAAAKTYTAALNQLMAVDEVQGLIASVEDVEGVARIGETGYPSLKDAVEAALDGEEIVLMESESLKETIVIDKEVTITAENGAEISRASVKSGRNQVVKTIFKIESEGNLTLRDITLRGDRAAESSVKKYNTFTPISCSGSLVMEKGAVISGFISHRGGGLTIENGGTATINGGEISNNTAISLGDLRDDRAYGGGVYVKNGNLFINGGQIINNIADSDNDKNGAKGAAYGGGIYIAAGSVVLNDGQISGNTVGTASFPNSDGGGIFVGDECTFIMNGGEISNNTALKKGGGICIGEDQPSASDKVQLIAGTISGNHAKTGGGIYVSLESELALERVVIAGNTAYTGGGAWSCAYGKGYFYATRSGFLSGNSADRRGGDFNSLSQNKNSILHLASRLHNGKLVRWYQDGEKGGWFDEEIGTEEIPNIEEYIDIWKQVQPSPFGDDISVRNETDGSYEGDDYYKLFITGNTADAEGGGIAFNGVVRMGEDADINVKVEKKWLDESGTDITQTENHPESIKVTLVNEDTNTELETVELNSENNWCHEFKGLPEAVYTVEEEAVEGWESEVGVMAKKDGEDRVYEIAVTNKPSVKTMDVKVVKTWLDKDGFDITNTENHPEFIKVTLVNKTTDTKLETVELNNSNNWSYEFKDLPEAEYTVEEELVEGWESEVGAMVKKGEEDL